ncbi:hypothetical protein ACN2XU_22265 [Primorskyibacter sp. 2E107]|uniref:hypothetical protein n=1 Tax=Primorskyibacter sp. 2E107 TaxID=3403458 RepID=UPI003AF69B4E
MIKRFALAMLVALTGLAVMIYPVVAQAAFGHAGCGISEIVAEHEHPPEGHTLQTDHGMSEHVSTSDEQAVCCDVVCSVDYPFDMGERPTAFLETCLPHPWDSTSLIDQSGPFGLKRPPRV